MAPSSPVAGRIRQLDVLRGVAVLLVLVHHAPTRVSALLKGGWTGVDLFFVLSGFLVSGLLLKEYVRSRQIRPWRFYVRRGFKIYPGFYVMLLVTAAGQLWTGFPPEPRLLWHEVVFVQNYLPTAWWGRDHSWSLAIEEHFYFLLPLVLSLLLRSDRFRRSPVQCGTVIMAAIGATLLGIRCAMVRNGDTASEVLFKTHTRLDSLALGVLLSVVWHFAPARIDQIRRNRGWLLAVGVLLIAPSYLLTNEHRFVLSLGLTLNYLGYGMVLAAALTSERALVGPLTSPLAWIGFYSYSIYLWHLPVLALAQHWLGGRPLEWVVYYAASLIVGVGMASLVELPALRLRERWLPAEASRTRHTA
jgi:peptidoglycan/LPS O-acetylase OafA/YrhL